MNIIYNSVDITNSVQPVALTVTDNAGGKPDSYRRRSPTLTACGAAGSL